MDSVNVDMDVMDLPKDTSVRFEPFKTTTLEEKKLRDEFSLGSHALLKKNNMIVKVIGLPFYSDLEKTFYIWISDGENDLAVKVEDLKILGHSKTAKKGVEYTYSCAMVYPPKEIGDKILEWGKENIPDEIIYTDPEDSSLGRENDPHVTLKYGILSNDASDIEKVLEGEGPIKLSFGKVDTFDRDEKPYDVIFVSVDSEDMERLNKKISDSLESKDTYKDYHPHLTIAYVKKGEGSKYKGKSFPLEDVEVDKVIYNVRGTDKKVPVKIASEYSRDDAGSYDDGDPDSVRYAPTKPLFESNVDTTYMATQDIDPFSEEGNPEELNLVRHQPLPDTERPKKPISLFPERTSELSGDFIMKDATTIDKQAQINFQIIEVNETPKGKEAFIRLPRSLTKATDIRSLNDFFKDFIDQQGWRVKKALGEGVEFSPTNQYFPDVHDDYVDFIVPIVGSEEDLNLPEHGSPIEKEEERKVTYPDYQTFDYATRTAGMFREGEAPRWVSKEDIPLWELATERSKQGKSTDYKPSYRELLDNFNKYKDSHTEVDEPEVSASTRVPVMEALQDRTEAALRPSKASFTAFYFQDTDVMHKVEKLLKEKDIPFVQDFDDDSISVPWFEMDRAADALKKSRILYRSLIASRRPVRAELQIFKMWISGKLDVRNDLDRIQDWSHIASVAPHKAAEWLEEYIDRYAILISTARVVHQSDGWHVVSEEGRNLGGPYDTKPEAEKRLKQVEYFKHQGKYNGEDTLMKESRVHYKPIPDTPEQRQEMRYDPKHPSSKNLKYLSTRLIDFGVPAEEIRSTLVNFPLLSMDSVYNAIIALMDLGEKHGVSDSEMMAEWR